MRTPSAFEASFIFFPQPQLRGDPSHVGLRYEDIWLTADDGVRTHAWFIRGEENASPGEENANPGEENASPRHSRGACPVPRYGGGNQQRILMLITHGNGGNISVRLDQYREFATRFRHVDIFALEYRGYGLSEGSPSEEGFALDAIAARRWIDNHIASLRASSPRECTSTGGTPIKEGDPAPIIVYFGRSLGGAVATRLASVMPPDALILECPISSIPHLAKTMTPWRFLPIDRFIHNRFDTVAHMRDVRCPVLVMHSEFDEIVPIESGRMVYEAAPGPKHFYLIKGAPHNGADYYDPEGYYAAIAEFLDQVAGVGNA